MPSHIPSLTPLRGIAALFIVLHSYTAYLLPGIGASIEQYSQFLKNSYLWVDFFFILSGFVLTHVYQDSFRQSISSKKYRKFILARFARIYPLHIFMLGAFVLFEIASIGLFIVQNNLEVLLSGGSTYEPFGDNHSIPSLLTNIFLLQAIHEITTWNEPAWSISAEWIAYIVFPAVACFVLGRTNKVCGLIYVATLVALYILIELTRGHLDFAGYPSFIRCILECVLGITLYHFHRSSSGHHFFSSSQLFFVTFTVLLSVMHLGLHDILTIPLLSLLIIIAAKNRGLVEAALNSKPMIFLGDISYSIYMTHWFIQYVTLKTWGKLFHSEFGENMSYNESLAVLALYIMLVVVVSWATYNIIEKPMRYRLKNSPIFNRFIK